jgi:hypothetical protein
MRWTAKSPLCNLACGRAIPPVLVGNVSMRRDLAERQEAMKKNLLAARETFRNCAFRDSCCEPGEITSPEACNRCSPRQLQKLVRRSGSSSS